MPLPSFLFGSEKVPASVREAQVSSVLMGTDFCEEENRVVVALLPGGSRREWRLLNETHSASLKLFMSDPMGLTFSGISCDAGRCRNAWHR